MSTAAVSVLILFIKKNIKNNIEEYFGPPNTCASW